MARAYVTLYLVAFLNALCAEHAMLGESRNVGRGRGIDLVSEDLSFPESVLVYNHLASLFYII